jgi:hypothetical protein
MQEGVKHLFRWEGRAYTVCGAFDFSCNFLVKFPAMGKQISVKCDQMPHCWAHIFVVKGLKVVSPNPQHVLFRGMQDGAQFKYPHPREMVSIKFQRVGKQKSIKCPTYARPPPLGLNIDRCINNINDIID